MGEEIKIEKKYWYQLLDLAGNVEDEKEMRPAEQKKLNEALLNGERFLRWAPKYLRDADK